MEGANEETKLVRGIKTTIKASGSNAALRRRHDGTVFTHVVN